MHDFETHSLTTRRYLASSAPFDIHEFPSRVFDYYLHNMFCFGVTPPPPKARRYDNWKLNVCSLGNVYCKCLSSAGVGHSNAVHG